METILLAVLFVLYLAVLFIFTTTQTSKKTASARFLMKTSTLQTFSTYLSEIGTDVGYWLFAILPIAATALANNMILTGIVLIGMCVVLIVIRSLYVKKLRLYTEICGSPVTLTDFLINRFRPKHTLAFRILFGSVLTVLPLVCGIGILISAADFLAKVSGWNYLLCVILCSFAVLLCIFQTGLVVTFQSGILHSFLLMIAFILMTVFALIGPDFSSADWQTTMTSALSLTAETSFDALPNYLAAGLCLLGLPTVYHRMMRQKTRHSHRRHTIVYLVLFLVFSLLVLVPFIRGAAAGQSGPDALVYVARSVNFPLFGALIYVAVTIGMIGASASLLTASSTSLWNDLILPIGKKEISVRTERTTSTFIGLVACIAALFLRGWQEDLFSFSISCLASVLGPILFFALYRKRTSASAVSFASLAALLTAVLFRFSINPSADFLTVLPAMAVSVLSLIVFGLFTFKTNADILNEFDRVDVLVRSNGNLFDNVEPIDPDEISRQ